VELVVDRTQVATLRPGDGAHYPSALAHAYRNVGDEPAEILTVSTPPKPV
jgi:mannose-6-phosphate isomerase-like protein (cupin superfamily)